MSTKISFEEKYNLLTARMFMFAARFLNQNFRAAGIDISREQWTVLAFLWKKDGVSQQVIADETGRDKPSTTRLLDNLEKLGYIERKADKNDRRSNIIFLTQQGKKSEKWIMEVVDNTFGKMTAGIPDNELEIVRKTFNTIYRNIEKIV